MKQLAFFLAAVLCSLQQGCNESNQAEPTNVFVIIDVEMTFQNDLVSLVLDGKPLLESRITTNNVVSLAWSSGFLELSNKAHSLTFSVVEQGVTGGFNIDLSNDTSTVAIRFNRSSKQIQFQQYKGRLWRD
jgi:hypothetical protein